MVNDSTREYSVYVSGTDGAVQGSGVLFYVGGNTMFVFTCAHVVDDLEKVKLLILKTIDASKDLYDVFCTEVPASQIIFSPQDVVNVDEGGDKTHTEDLAIIQISKPVDLEIATTEYFFAETNRNNSVYVQGYPNGISDGKKPIECLDCLHGCVVVNPADSNKFIIRMDDQAIDKGNRVYELKGLSGAPVWDDDQEANGLLGLLVSAYGSTASLSKANAIKAHQIRSIMKDRFGIVIERRLDGIPEDDVAIRDFTPVVFNGTISKEETKPENEKWVQDQLTGLRSIIEDMKLQKAIDKGKEIVADQRYKSLSKASQKKVKQYLLYCYEVAYLDDEFEALEVDMRESGLIKDHDTLRQFTRSFMKKDFQETIRVAQCYIDTQDKSTNNLLSFAKAFLVLARAYTEDLPVEKTIGQLLNEDENFILPTEGIEDEALIYQLIGYVYGEKYHDYVNSVRFLNRAYRIGFDSMILESLGAAYYHLGIDCAIDEYSKKLDLRKIDFKSLYKARECYLIIKGKADDLFWSGTMRRMGMCVYNTFVFLKDNYRILTIYQDIKKYIKNLTDDEWHDVEMNYAIVSSQKGEINTSEFKHITTTDRILLDAIAKSSKCANRIEDVTANVPSGQIRRLTQFEKEVRDTTKYLEDAVRRIDRRERTPIYVQMINFYGRGIQLFGWNKKDKLNELYQRLSEYADPDLLESMSNFIFEIDAPIEESIKRFKTAFEHKKNIMTWQELNHLYIRHGMLSEADAMYRELFSERKELIEEGPEYAYRAFIDYVMLYKRDLKYALQCYLDAKEAFQDTDIEGYWELELMLYSRSFNNPERFENERKHFVDKGLVAEGQYHRAAFIAYLVNLNEIKAMEHYNFIQQYQCFVNPKTGMPVASSEEIFFLNWIGAVQPRFLLSPGSMVENIAAELRAKYDTETWHRTIDKPLQNQFSINKSIAIDAWSLYQLAEADKLDILKTLDYVFVSHITITRLLDELSKTNSGKIRWLLDFIKECNKFHIYSASFKAQLEVRNVTGYSEPASTVAIGVEKECIVIYGEPVVDNKLVEHFGNRIIRVNEIESLIRQE